MKGKVPMILSLLLAACSQVPAIPGPSPVLSYSEDGIVRAAQNAPQGTGWLTFEGLHVEGGNITALVRVQPTGCPPTPPPTYGSMEVWVAPYQGVTKKDIGNGYWKLGSLAQGTHYRVFAWYLDQCGVQHTSDEIDFDTP